MAKNITPRSRDFSQWYLDVIRAAELADYAPVRGCMVIRPTGYALWESIQRHFDEAFKETGHVNAYFPLLIPNSFLEKEAQHVEGFAPECAVVTHAGGEELEEPFVVRPTSETVIGHMYSKWVQSWRDLPILINQWCNVMRWEKRPRLFLRTSEFLWQEGHTAHATREEAMEETLRMLDVYQRIMKEVLALPVVPGEKSEGERFPGADNTFTCEAMMSDKKALQAGTSHFLGQNFAKAFDIKFQDRDGEVRYAWTTSWGVSTRLIGALIMTHSDDDGLILPPKVAPVKLALLPISTDQDLISSTLEPKAAELKAAIEAAIGRRTVELDTRYHLRPSDRFFHHLQRGVPLRAELGERELANQTLRLVRRDTGERIDVPMGEAPQRVLEVLEDVQRSLYERALNFRLSNTFQVSSMEEFKEVLESRGGFITAFFGGTKEDERAIKEATGATVRCFPLEDDSLGTCFYTGRQGCKRAVFAKAY
ncbi:prolyl-tRNA synthetase, family I [Thermanaerovibrio velox DSM 12556]|uniref:Proline--tRNA ligase n=1 Tax=Thermanaerovibrio velox DSM 12556 TaxID=926567 RepID=H0UPG9_9BACT|nr:proline--tRNA ligase [Thermanaerovibrio velox]EHM10600.1 prolyl-tRNA synthetase, family I [Thermanaerovibrio velox DSM 12556]